MGKSAGSSVSSTREIVGRPRRRFSTCARKCALAVSSEVGEVSVRCAMNFRGTPGELAPGASKSGVSVAERTKSRSTMLRRRTG